MLIATDYVERLLHTLQLALSKLEALPEGSLEHDIYRHAVIKEFELALETCGKLCRKALKAYSGSPKEIDSLTYNDVFRRCTKHGLLEPALVQRWMTYRLNRNSTAHDYGLAFVKETLTLLPNFMVDVEAIVAMLNQHFGASDA